MCSLLFLCCHLSIPSIPSNEQDVNDYYTFHEELGKGQFGTTYLVTDKKTGEQAACKAIAKRKLQNKDDIEVGGNAVPKGGR